MGKVLVNDRPDWWETQGKDYVELEPCPFCGDDDLSFTKIYTHDVWWDSALRGEDCWCISCYCGCSLKDSHKTDLIERWNGLKR